MNPAGAKRIAQDLQLLCSARLRSVRFHGLSMSPFLKEGDRVTVEPVCWEDIKRGDIVTYRCEAKYPTRRVVSKRRDRLLLWCDNWPALRFTMARTDLLGRVVMVERDGKLLHHRDPEWLAVRRRALAMYRRSVLAFAWRRLKRLAGSLLRAPRRVRTG